MPQAVAVRGTLGCLRSGYSSPSRNQTLRVLLLTSYERTSRATTTGRLRPQERWCAGIRDRQSTPFDARPSQPPHERVIPTYTRDPRLLQPLPAVLQPQPQQRGEVRLVVRTGAATAGPEGAGPTGAGGELAGPMTTPLHTITRRPRHGNYPHRRSTRGGCSGCGGRRCRSRTCSSRPPAGRRLSRHTPRGPGRDPRRRRGN
jgi:hypothetical protein